MGALKLSYYENTSLTRHDEYGFLRVEPKNGVTIRQSSNYSTFGAQMPGRNYTSSSYRYGMNGQEHEDEVAQGIYTAEYWEYDSRLGRRWNRDPVVMAWLSPYATFGNNPIFYSDPNGLSPKEGDGDGKKDVAFPSNPKDGQEHVHVDKENNTNWGYVYDKDKGWIGTGASTTLKTVEVSAKYDPKGINKVGNDIAKFLTNSHFKFEVGGQVDIGLAVEVEGKFWGQDVSANASIMNANLVRGSNDLAAPMSDPNSYSGSYIGKNGVVEMSQGGGIEFTKYLSADYEHSWDAINIMSDMNSGYRNDKHVGNITIGLPLLKRSNSNDVMKKNLGNMQQNHGTTNTKAIGKAATEKSFFGLDIGVGAQIILGVKANIKIGLEHD